MDESTGAKEPRISAGRGSEVAVERLRLQDCGCL